MVLRSNTRRGNKKTTHRHSAAAAAESPRSNLNNKTHETEEDLKLYLGTLEQMNNDYEVRQQAG